MATATTYTFYFAGELFSAKHLLGNALLAEAIQLRSRGRYLPLLPQDLEQRDTTAHAIRDQDIRAVLRCDLGLFHYDGPELDSGTVVEFMFAKFADIPSILLRTDFRNAGDQREGDPWNLMSSFYPRTRVISLNSMEIYQEAAKRATVGASAGKPDTAPGPAASRAMIDRIADEVIQAFDGLIGQPPALPADLTEAVYHWLALMPGFRAFASTHAAIEELRQLHAGKQAKGLL